MRFPHATLFSVNQDLAKLIYIGRPDGEREFAPLFELFKVQIVFSTPNEVANLKDDGKQTALILFDLRFYNPETVKAARSLRVNPRLQEAPLLFLISDPAVLSHLEEIEFFDFILDEDRGALNHKIGFFLQIFDRRKMAQSSAIAKRAVENERENFRALFKQTPEMVCITRGPDHIFEFVNEAHVRTLGFNATGLSVHVAQPDSSQAHALLDQVYQTGETLDLREQPITVTNKLRYFNLTYSARRSEDGAIDGVMILGSEITEQLRNRAELRDSEDRLRLTIEAIPQGIWRTNPDGSADYCSERFCEMLHLPREQILGWGWVGLIHPDDQPRVVEEWERCRKANSPVSVDFRALIEGQYRWMLSLGNPFFDAEGRLIKYFGTWTDIHQEREMKAEAERAREEAERANELKSAFLANMSHEIRTPLGAMIGFTDLLRDPGISEEERQSFLDILSRNAESLSVIINDILDLSKVEAGHLTLEYTDCDPQKTANEVVALFKLKSNEKNLAITYERDPSTPLRIVSDAVRVRQVLLNLVGNAVKFTPKGGVSIRSYGQLDEGGRQAVCFEITDTGIGIPAAELDRVFEMFVQADGSMTRRFGGTGLGLALSRRLARSLGGDVIILSSRENEGTTFLFSIEDRPQHRDQITTAPSLPRTLADSSAGGAQSRLEGVHVLVVDDAADNQELIARYLNKQGALVDKAGDGVEGCRKALSQTYDIVLMDIQMPRMDGFSATLKLRATGYEKPIVALTAHAMTEVRRKCLEVGCNDHLTKPIQPKELVETIARLTHR